MPLDDFTDYDPEDDDEASAAEGSASDGDAVPEDGAAGPSATDGSPSVDGADADGAAGVGGDGDASVAGAGGSADGASTDGASEDGEESSLSFERVDGDAPAAMEGLGHLSASQGLHVDETGEDSELWAYVTTENRDDVRLGTYVLASYPDGERLFCRVEALEYAHEYHGDDATELRARRAMHSDGIDEADFKFLARLAPVAVLYEEDGELRRRATDRIPKPETTVQRATDAEEIKTGLKIPGDGIFLGHLAVGGERVRTAAEPPTIDYRLDDSYEAGDPLLFRHTLIAGGTGSGKTHAAKNVLRQVLDEDRTYPMGDGRSVQPAVVVFDPQDEYAQLHDDNPELDAATERRYEREGVAHGGHDDTVCFVPKVGSAQYEGGNHRAEQVEFTIPFSMVRTRPWLVAGSGLNDNQYQALDGVLLDRFFQNYGSEGTYEEFCEFLDDPALREELDESGRVHEATYDAVRRRVQGFGHVFDQDAPPITEQVRELVNAGRCSVVPTYHISNARDAETVVLAVATLLVGEKLSSDPRYDRIKETPLLVGMDEAHNYLSDAESVQARKVIGTFTDAAKQGRKERLGLFLVTQDPQDVHEAVFKQLNTTVVLNLGDEDAISAVNIPTNLEQKVPYMEQGQMVVYSPDNSEPVELVGLEHCTTKHG